MVWAAATLKAPACSARSPTSPTTARLWNSNPASEGPVHVSEMDWTNKNVAPSKLVALGDEVEVMVLKSTKTSAAFPWA